MSACRYLSVPSMVRSRSRASSNASTASSFCSYESDIRSEDTPYTPLTSVEDVSSIPLPKVDDCRILDPEPSVPELCRNDISSSLSHILSIDHDVAFSKVKYGRDGKNGHDFIFPLGFLRTNVDELAERVLNQFKSTKLIASVRREGNFLVFTCQTTALVNAVLQQVHNQPDYGFHKTGRGQKIIVEYSSPNIAKPFHLGHLRPTIIGAFIRNLYYRSDWNVTAMNYLGDWGTQFGMIAVGFGKYGSQEKLERNPCHHLFEVYVQVSKDAETDPSVKVQAADYFRRMEEGDKEALANWHVWRQYSVQKYKENYAQLNAHFDVYTGESAVGHEWQNKAIERLEELQLIEDKKGMKLLDLTKWNLERAVLRKRDGTSIYLSRDIAEAIYRHDEYAFDKMIYVVASQQDLHLSQVCKILQLMEFGWADKLQHINHGLVLSMSTRKGTVVFLDNIIDQTTDFMHNLMKSHPNRYARIENPRQVAEEIAITAIKIQDLSAKRIKNYPFDWKRMKAYKGNRGPYLQYTYARLCSIRRRNQHLLPIDPSTIDNSCLIGPDIHKIAFLLGTYPDVIEQTKRTHEPSTVVTFCFRLSRAVMRVWDTTRVCGEEDIKKARARLWLYECSRTVLKSAMTLLTLRPQERV